MSKVEIYYTVSEDFGRRNFLQYVKDWSIYIDYLNEILPIERVYGIAEKDLIKWHSLLQQSFRKQPDSDAVRDFTLGIGFTEEIANEMNDNIAVMRANKKIVNIIKNLYKNFDSLIK